MIGMRCSLQMSNLARMRLGLVAADKNALTSVSIRLQRTSKSAR